MYQEWVGNHHRSQALKKKIWSHKENKQNHHQSIREIRSLRLRNLILKRWKHQKTKISKKRMDPKHNHWTSISQVKEAQRIYKGRVLKIIRTILVRSFINRKRSQKIILQIHSLAEWLHQRLVNYYRITLCHLICQKFLLNHHNILLLDEGFLHILN